MKFQKVGTKSLWFMSFKIGFLVVILQYLLPLDQNSSLTPFWGDVESTQMSRKLKLKILKKSGDWDLVSPSKLPCCCTHSTNSLKHVKLFFFYQIWCTFYTQITYNIKMEIQYKKITTHALNVMDYNPKNIIRFLI